VSILPVLVGKLAFFVCFFFKQKNRALCTHKGVRNFFLFRIILDFPRMKMENLMEKSEFDLNEKKKKNVLILVYY
jgi:hypothetical protein